MRRPLVACSATCATRGPRVSADAKTGRTGARAVRPSHGIRTRGLIGGRQHLAQSLQGGQGHRHAAYGEVADQRQAERGKRGQQRDRGEPGAVEQVGHRTDPSRDCEWMSEEGQHAEETSPLSSPTRSHEMRAVVLKTRLRLGHPLTSANGAQPLRWTMRRASPRVPSELLQRARNSALAQAPEAPLRPAMDRPEPAQPPACTRAARVVRAGQARAVQVQRLPSL